MAAESPATIPILRGASTPGGMAPHYRVQFQASGQGAWQLYAVFTRREAAESCLLRLQIRGHRTRLVNYRCCSTAA